MTKSELIAAIATEGHTKAEVAAILESLSRVVQAAVAEGHTVEIPGLVKIGTTVRAAREGRNPATGATIQIAEKRTAKVKAVSTLQKAVA